MNFQFVDPEQYVNIENVISGRAIIVNKNHYCIFNKDGYILALSNTYDNKSYSILSNPHKSIVEMFLNNYTPQIGVKSELEIRQIPKLFQPIKIIDFEYEL